MKACAGPAEGALDLLMLETDHRVLDRALVVEASREHLKDGRLRWLFLHLLISLQLVQYSTRILRLLELATDLNLTRGPHVRVPLLFRCPLLALSDLSKLEVGYVASLTFSNLTCESAELLDHVLLLSPIPCHAVLGGYGLRLTLRLH